MFRLFGFEVRIQLSFVIMALVLGAPRSTEPAELMSGLSWLVVLTVSILVHELGHAFAVRGFGGQARIELYALGGLTSHQHPRGLSYGRRAVISLAGPFAGFAFGGVAVVLYVLGLGRDSQLAEIALGQMLWVNFGYGVLNLLPVLPLDGGHALKAGLDSLTNGRGLRPTLWVSLAVSALGTAVGLYAGQLFAGLMGAFLGFSAWQQLRQSQAAGVEEAAPWRRGEDRTRGLFAGTAADERELERHLREGTRAERTDAVRRLALMRVMAGDPEGASELLSQLPQDERPPALILGAIAHARGDHDDAVPLLYRALAGSEPGSPERRFVLSILALSLVGSEQPESAIALLEEHATDLPERGVGAALDKALFDAGHYALAAQVGGALFERHGAPVDAYNAACSLARLHGRDDEAMAWLERAAGAGFDDIELLDTDDDLAPLRERGDFAALRRKVEAEAG